jgi:hypothetical protein
VAAPVLLVENARVKRLLYVALSLVPAVLTLLVYVEVFRGLYVILLVILIVLPMSLTLALLGLVLALRARGRQEAWRWYAAGALLSSSPSLAVAVLAVRGG